MTFLIPTSYYIHVTGCCNYSCIYCYNQHNRFDRIFKKELKTNEYSKFFQELMTYSPSKITLTGGEPLLRKDLKTILVSLQQLSQNSVFISLNTNGSQVNAENVKWLVDLTDEISISIDGFRSINDRMRGSGAFDRALDAINFIFTAGGIPSISITKTSLNDTQVNEFITYMQNEWGIRSFRINEVKIIGRAKKSPWLYSGNYPSNVVRGRNPVSFESCFNGEKCFGQTLNLLPNGDCYPCHYLQDNSYYLGNIERNIITDIYQRINDIKNKFSSP